MPVPNTYHQPHLSLAQAPCYQPLADCVRSYGGWLSCFSQRALGGGLMLGYGARIAFGCNIGAYFRGLVSTSLPGWLWLLGALLGTTIGVKLRTLWRPD